MQESLCMEKNLSITKWMYLGIKRFFDIIFSLIGVVIMLPIALFTKIAYMITGDFTSIFYKQRRVGKNGKYIDIYKFRSMVPDAETILSKWLKENKEIKNEYYKYRKLSHDPRITKVGKILRKTSLDELPQFINIFLGDMSLIGPRPVLEDEAEEYRENKAKFLSMRPGLTGYWACNGRSCTSYEERRRLELYYIDHCSLWLDFKIVFLTIVRVIKGEGAQ